jgi:hypothetical protein
MNFIFEHLVYLWLFGLPNSLLTTLIFFCLRNDEVFAKKVQEDLDRELAYKIENEDLKRNRTNSFDRGSLAGFNGNEHGFDDSHCTITSTSPTPTYRRFSSDHGRSIHSSNVS